MARSVAAKPLKLLAQSEDDLKVVSAAVQDAVGQISGIGFDASARRLTVEMNRFAWEDGPKAKRRARSILGIDNVLSVKTRALPQDAPGLTVSLLSVDWTSGETPPGGTISLHWAGDGELRAEVEALEVTLLDSGQSWPARKRPAHKITDR